MRHRLLWAVALFAIVLSTPAARAATFDLDGAGWNLQSAAALGGAGGATLSKSTYQPQGWYGVTVPCTVLGGLVQNNVYPDPYTADHLQNIDASAFANANWWYRKTFTLPASEAGNRVWLDFKGVSYRANVWLNGVLVTDSNHLVGTYREFELDITDKVLIGGQTNVLAVEVFMPGYNDLRIWFADWITRDVPDRNMGLFLPVTINTSGPVIVRHPLVTASLALPSLASADLTVLTEVGNGTTTDLAGTLWATITGPGGETVAAISQTVAIPHGVLNQRVTFSVKDFPQLHVTRPAVWWPWQMGPQNLYTLTLRYTRKGVESDSLTTRFGIRQITASLDSSDTINFKVNGKPFLVRGAAWAPDMFLKWDPARQVAEMLYVRDLNMNTIRLEGKLMNDPFFELADQMGIVVMAGWMFGAGWEKWSLWNTEEYTVAYESLKTQIYRLRTHPSLLVWLNGSDHHPPADVEQQYLNIEADLQWPNPILSHAAGKSDDLTGPSGVKMLGPYDWEPPIYWYNTDAPGAAWGFNTEVGPGGAIPPLESLKKMLPADHLWPIDDMWNLHACQNGYTVATFTNALSARYGTAASLEDYAKKAQLAAYESHRAMFEAFGRNKYNKAWGNIQWMLNSAWPSMMWHLYDYYLRPGGSYFGAKIACEPIHIQYAYDNQAIYVIDSSYTTRDDLTASADVYNLDGTLKWHGATSCIVNADGVTRLFALPAISGLSSTYFLRLTLRDGAGTALSINSYWLSTKSDVLDLTKTNAAGPMMTPCSSYADLTGLQRLAPATLGAKAWFGTGRAQVTVSNRGAAIAVGVHLKLTQGAGGEEVLPIRWEDNYFMLLPGESRLVAADYDPAALGRALPFVVAECFNGAATVQAGQNAVAPGDYERYR